MVGIIPKDIEFEKGSELSSLNLLMFSISFLIFLAFSIIDWPRFVTITSLSVSYTHLTLPTSR